MAIRVVLKEDRLFLAELVDYLCESFDKNELNEDLTFFMNQNTDELFTLIGRPSRVLYEREKGLEALTRQPGTKGDSTKKRKN